MVPIVSDQEIRALDTWCHVVAGIEPSDLMERASIGLTEALIDLLDQHTDVRTILIAAGPGNNGGDGLCVARLLAQQRPQLTIRVVDVEHDQRVSDLRARAHRLLPPAVEHVSQTVIHREEPPDVIVDAMLGIGGTEHLREPMSDLLAVLNAWTSLRVAIDVPTGLHPNTGHAHSQAFRADVTLTISAEKRGFWLNDGPSHTGRIVVVPLGVDGEEQQIPTSLLRYTAGDIRRLLPQRPRRFSKFDAGRVVVIGGTTSMPGAPSMTAHAALRSGAGLVHLAAPEVHPLTPREVIVHPLPWNDEGTIARGAYTELHALVKKASVVAIGPGLGTSEETIAMLASLVNDIDPAIPVILDADGLRLLPQLRRSHAGFILTPHRGEYARMNGCTARELNDDPIEIAHAWCAQHDSVLHLKDTPSVTCWHRDCVLTVNGTPRMATAGSGDVLTGIIAGLVAQGLSPFDATSLGAFLHAEAGTRASRGASDQPIIATDILHHLPMLLGYSLST